MVSRTGAVVVADAQSTWRLGVRTAFEAEGYIVAAEARTAEEAVAAALTRRPDACIVGMALPGGALDAARQIADRLPGTAVVLLAQALDDDEMIAALRAGASGYLSREIEASRLVAAVRGVLLGELAIPRGMLPALVDEIRVADRRQTARVLRERGVWLTPREWQIFELLARDLSTQEIAADLGISAVTVRRHISETLRKLGVADRDAARGLFRRIGQAK
jgi:RNA polymerase sigma factor (sigma-70 family)